MVSPLGHCCDLREHELDLREHITVAASFLKIPLLPATFFRPSVPYFVFRFSHNLQSVRLVSSSYFLHPTLPRYYLVLATPQALPTSIHRPQHRHDRHPEIEDASLGCPSAPISTLHYLIEVTSKLLINGPLPFNSDFLRFLLLFLCFLASASRPECWTWSEMTTQSMVFPSSCLISSIDATGIRY